MTVAILEVIREAQIPVVAGILLVASATKVRNLVRPGSRDANLGPTTLFPLNMRKPVAMTMCVAEAGLGLGLIVTAQAKAATGGVATATIARIGAGVLFLVATSALIELRTVRPDVGCGCFGDFSTAPVSGRTIARSALLALAIFSTIGVAVRLPRTGTTDLELLAIGCVEFLLLGFLSPEIGEGLIRLGYSEPCELKAVPSTRTLTALRRSKQWRRYGGMVASEMPADIWRELCWRYVAYPSSYKGRPADLVFAVFLQYRRPVVHAALVDSSTGVPLPWPEENGRKRWLRRSATNAANAAGPPDMVEAAAPSAAATLGTPDGTVTADGTAAANGTVTAERTAAADGTVAAEGADEAATAPLHLVPDQPEAADLPLSTRL